MNDNVKSDVPLVARELSLNEVALVSGGSGWSTAGSLAFGATFLAGHAALGYGGAITSYATLGAVAVVKQLAQ